MLNLLLFRTFESSATLTLAADITPSLLFTGIIVQLFVLLSNLTTLLLLLLLSRYYCPAVRIAVELDDPGVATASIQMFKPWINCDVDTVGHGNMRFAYDGTTGPAVDLPSAERLCRILVTYYVGYKDYRWIYTGLGQPEMEEPQPDHSHYDVCPISALAPTSLKKALQMSIRPPL